MAMGDPKAVVVGIQSNGLGIVRVLGRMGIKSIGIDENPRHYAATRYTYVIKCDDLEDYGLITKLIEIQKETSNRIPLFLTTDLSVPIVSRYRRELERYYILSLPSHEVINLLTNKGTLQRYAEQNGFQVPLSLSVRGERDVHKWREIGGLPCILKPSIKTSETFRYSPKKAYKIQSYDELIRTYRMISQWSEECIIQEWIPGPDTNLHFCLYYFDENSKPLAWFTGRKIRQYIPYCGTACAAEPWEDNFVRDEGIRFFQGVNYRGFGAIEFKIDERDGTYYLIEPTVGRTEHLFALAAVNGVNIPYIAYCDLTGHPQAPIKAPQRPVKYIDWHRDFKSARFYMSRSELAIREWIRTLRGLKIYNLWAKDDPGPFIYYWLSIGRRAWRKFERNLVSLVKTGINEISPRNFRCDFEVMKDIMNLRNDMSSDDEHIKAGLDWLKYAQDIDENDGVARSYCLKPIGYWKRGWAPSFPETTGYIIHTVFDCYYLYKDEDLKRRSIKMADWLCSVQLPDGGIPGGYIGETENPVVFDTGQVILGWCRAYLETKSDKYYEAICRAGDFLVEIRGGPIDGLWRKYTTIQNDGFIHAYDVRTSWSLLEAFKITNKREFLRAALENLESTLNLQHNNGWFDFCDLSPKRHHHPLTHTIAYTIRGFLESGFILEEERYILAAQRAADALLKNLQPDGFLAGRFNSEWQPAVKWSCLTGSAQMAVIWLRLYQITGDKVYLEGAKRVIRFLKSTQNLRSKNPGIRGGIKGSYPFNGGYGRYQFLSWGVKFFIDSLLLLKRINEPELFAETLSDRSSEEGSEAQ